MKYAIVLFIVSGLCSAGQALGMENVDFSQEGATIGASFCRKIFAIAHHIGSVGSLNKNPIIIGEPVDHKLNMLGREICKAVFTTHIQTVPAKRPDTLDEKGNLC